MDDVIYCRQEKPLTTMKTIIRFALRGLLVLIGLFLLLLLYLNWGPSPTYEEVLLPEIALRKDSLSLAHGKKLALLDCYGCHMGEDRKFSGRMFDDLAANKELGTIYTANITQDVEYGAGAYTPAELYRLLRTGVKRDGKLVSSVMPQLYGMSDDDLLSLISFLKSDDPLVQSSQASHPAYEPSFLARALGKMVFEPTPYNDKLPEPKPEVSAEYGAYLVNSRYICYMCHSEDLKKVDTQVPEQTPNYLEGGMNFVMEGYEVKAPGLAMHEGNRISDWSEAEFTQAIKYGIRPGGLPAFKEPMHPYPQLDSIEVRAIYAYLKEYGSR